MNRSDWLLLFLKVSPAGAQAETEPGTGPALDPIRVMKGLFLFQHEDADGNVIPLGGAPYDFVPYAYGPFTRAIYADLEELEGRRLVSREPLAGRSYVNWRLSEAGRARAEHLLAAGAVDADAIGRLRHAKRETLRGFAALLKYVYERHPGYARESVAAI